jgi:hypothetical protein
MRTLVTLLSVLVAVSLLVPFGSAFGSTGKTVSGKVAAVSSQAIVVDVGSGKKVLDVGAIVQPGSKLTVEGKNAPIGDLSKDVLVGDTVTLSYAMTDNLYAEHITKK